MNELEYLIDLVFSPELVGAGNGELKIRSIAK